MSEHKNEAGLLPAPPAAPAEDESAATEQDAAEPDQNAAGSAQVRRRRRRGGRGRSSRSAPGGQQHPPEASAEIGTSRRTVLRGTTGTSAAEAPDVDPEMISLDDPPQALAVISPEQDEESQTEPAAPVRRRRRRRGGRGRSRRPAAAGADQAEMTDEAVVETKGEAQGAQAGEVEPSPGETAPTGPEEQRPATRRRRRPSTSVEKEVAGGDAEAVVATRRRKPAAATKAEIEPTPAAPETPPVETPPSPATRSRRARTPGRRRREQQSPVVRATDKVMLITEVGDRDQIAVLEDRTLVEHYITRAGARSMVGNIYLGKVQNVLPGMEAAFVDIGRGRNAVLYAGEVSYDEEIEGEAPRIEQVLRGGQNVMVQVTKDPMGGKGARLTQQVSIPGRYLVLVPNSQVFGISRRLPERERARLKDILRRIRPAEHGVIVRTAAESAPAEDLQADLERLMEEWAAIAKSAKRGKAPRVLYEEPELTVRVVRDLFIGGEFKELVTDSVPVYDQVVAYLRSVAADVLPRVHLHEGPLPLLEDFHVVEQIHKALDRKVWLPSGGYLVIDRTEALTVIDVNTGKHVGKANLEETVTKTNIEAAEEVARQLRLRDIGGIIIVDFIDMLLEKNKDKVIQAVKDAMAQDKTRSQVFDIGPLGLLQITRKRVSAGLLESFSETCPTCEGRGILITFKA